MYGQVIFFFSVDDDDLTPALSKGEGVLLLRADDRFFC